MDEILPNQSIIDINDRISNSSSNSLGTTIERPTITKLSSDYSHLNSSSLDDFIAKFQTTKISWRGKYERIFGLALTGFCTIDPKDFNVTNTWPYSALLEVLPDPVDEQVFTLHLKGAKKLDALKLKCKYRSFLLGELFRLQQESLACISQITSNPSNSNTFYCKKKSRNEFENDCILEITTDAICHKRSDGTLVSRYSYTLIEYLKKAGGNGIIVGYVGRGRVFMTQDRENLISKIQIAASILGLDIRVEETITFDEWKFERQKYGKFLGTSLVKFNVQKISIRHSEPVARKLRIYEEYLVESDISSQNTVSVRTLSSIFSLIRSNACNNAFDIEYNTGDKRSYLTNERDGILAAIYDACKALKNNVVTINFSPNQRGLRLFPCFAKEDPAETSLFFGDTSIASCMLKRIAAISKWSGGGGYSAGAGAGRSLMYITEEFNANVPTLGIDHGTKKHYITDALRPLCSHFLNVTNSEIPAPKMAVTLLQCFYRISRSYYGIRELLEITGMLSAFCKLLSVTDELTVFWTLLVIQALTQSVDRSVEESSSRPRDIEGENLNKNRLFGYSKLVSSMVSLLEQPTRGPLIALVVVEILEAALCSCRDSTSSEIFQSLLSLVAERYEALIRFLMVSLSATTVECCTLLTKTIIEEIDIKISNSIKDAALNEGIVLRHFYKALYDKSLDQRYISRFLIGLWMSYHKPAKDLLFRMLPQGLINFLDMPMLLPSELSDLDKLEKGIFKESKTIDSSQSLSSNLDSFVKDSPAKVGQQEADKLEEEEANIEAEEDITTISMMNNKEAKLRLRNKIEKAEAGITQKKRQQPKGLMARIIHRQDVVDATKKTDKRSQENFRIFFHMLRQDHKLSDLIWNETTREELSLALNAEINLLNASQKSCSTKLLWNHHEFKVRYVSLEKELQVGDHYLHLLLSTYAGKYSNARAEEVVVQNPIRLFNSLYHRFLRERGDAEHLGIVTVAYLCLRCQILVYAAHHQRIGFVEDTCFFATLIQETEHAEMLELCLEMIQVLVYNEENACQLINTLEIELIVSLMKMIHTSRQDQTQSTPMWLIKRHHQNEINDIDVTKDVSFFEPKAYTVQMLTILIENGKLNIKDIQVKSCHIGNRNDWTPLLECKQLRWQLGLKGTFPTEKSCEISIDILKSLFRSQSSLGYKQRMVSPIPKIKRILSSPEILPHITQVFLTDKSHLSDLTAELLTLLSEFNLENMSQLYLTGVFYFIFLLQHVDNYEAITRFLNATHQHQKTESKSILEGILPDAMIYILTTYGNEKFADIFLGNISSPEVIWTQEMRFHLIKMIAHHLGDLSLCLADDVCFTYQYTKMAPVAYKELNNECWCFNYYLNNLCDESRFPEWPINNPVLFMREILIKWKEEVGRKKICLTIEQALNILDIKIPSEDKDIRLLEIREAFRKKMMSIEKCHNAMDEIYMLKIKDIEDAYQVLSAPRRSLVHDGFDSKNVLLLLKTQIILCRRYPQSLAPYKYAAYPLLLNILKLESKEIEQEKLELLETSTELIYLTCLVSPRNGESLVNECGMDVLVKLLDICLIYTLNIKEEFSPRCISFFNIVLHCVHTISGLVALDMGRQAIKQKEVLAKNLALLLSLVKEKPRLVQYSLEAISRMAQSEVLQKVLIEAGILLHLVHLLFIYDSQITADIRELQSRMDSDERAASNAIAIMSVRALGRLGGLLINDLESPKNLVAIACITALLTPPLFKKLKDINGQDLLSVFHSEVSNPVVIWNSSMRLVLYKFIQECIKNFSTTKEFDEKKIQDFRYQELCHQTVAGDIYLPMFEEYIKKEDKSFVLPDPNLFCFGLLNLLSARATNDIKPYGGWGEIGERSHKNRIALALRCLNYLLSTYIDVVEENLLHVRENGFPLLFRFLQASTREQQEDDNSLDNQSCVLHLLEKLSSRSATANAIASYRCLGALVQLVNSSDKETPQTINILMQLCRYSVIVNLILDTNSYVEILAWFVQVDVYVTDAEFQAGENLRENAAMLIRQMKEAPGCSLKVQKLLCNYFPLLIALMIVNHPEKAAAFFEDNHCNPELIWDLKTRNFLRSTLSELLKIARSFSYTIDFTVPIKQLEVIDYSIIIPDPCIGNVYLIFFLQNPTFPLRSPSYFLEMLLQTLVSECENIGTDTTCQHSLTLQSTALVRNGLDALATMASCVVCLLKLHSNVYESIHTWGYASSIINILSLLQSKRINGSPQLACLRLIHILAKSPLCVQDFSTTPIFQVLLYPHEEDGSPYYDTAFILEILRRVIINYPNNIVNAMDDGVIAVCIRMNVIPYLLNLLSTDGILNAIREPNIARVLCIEILKLLDNHPQQGHLAHALLKKNKKWKKQFRHENNDWFVPNDERQDHFLTGPAANAQEQIRLHNLRLSQITYNNERKSNEISNRESHVIRPSEVRASSIFSSQASDNGKGSF